MLKTNYIRKLINTALWELSLLQLLQVTFTDLNRELYIGAHKSWNRSS